MADFVIDETRAAHGLVDLRRLQDELEDHLALAPGVAGR